MSESSSRLAQESRALLERHALHPWFPRCLDREYGGFHCDFDPAWRRGPAPSVRFLEFQARQTRVAALALRAHPESGFWRDCLLHGWEFLSRAMWDPAEGGWYALCDADGTPRNAHRKHMHGTAYALQACLEVHHLLGIARARELVDETLAWAMKHGWVEPARSFRSWLERDGTPVRDATTDHCGVPSHLFDGNVNSDMLETLTDLSRAGWPVDAPLAAMHACQIGITRRHGHIPEWYTAEGEGRSPKPHAGRQFQAVRRFGRSMRHLEGKPCDAELDTLLWRAALAERTPRGTLRSPSGLEEWWVQLEWFAAAAFLEAQEPQAERPADRRALHVLDKVLRRYLDERDGGLRQVPLRLGLFGRTPKGSLWKDASHEAFAFGEAAGLLAG